MGAPVAENENTILQGPEALDVAGRVDDGKARSFTGRSFWSAGCTLRGRARTEHVPIPMIALWAYERGLARLLSRIPSGISRRVRITSNTATRCTVCGRIKSTASTLQKRWGLMQTKF